MEMVGQVCMEINTDSSELIAPVASHRVGLNRGSAEREDFVSRSQHWAKATPENRAVLSALLERWCSRVDPISPKLVCTNEEEVRVTMKCLSQLGAASSQLVLQLHGDGGRQWQKNIHRKHYFHRVTKRRLSMRTAKRPMTDFRRIREIQLSANSGRREAAAIG